MVTFSLHWMWFCSPVNTMKPLITGDLPKLDSVLFLPDVGAAMESNNTDHVAPTGKGMSTTSGFSK